jgi:hypothetical protein
MTICIGVLAAEEKAIVCVADRYITYGREILGETDSVKIVPLGDSGIHAMIAGSDDAIGRILAKLIIEDDLGKIRATTQNSCERVYQEAEAEVLEMRFLRPFLNSEEFKKALQKQAVNDVIKAISEEIRKDRENEEPTFACNLLLCGFDKAKKPFLLNLKAPGICVDTTLTGFCAVGSGSGYALQRMLSNEWKRKFPIDRALYEIFDAKVQAENDMNVGYDWDAIVLTAERAVTIPEDIKKMIDQAWIKLNRSPYEKHNPDEDLPLPPEDWMEKLKIFAETILPSS